MNTYLAFLFSCSFLSTFLAPLFQCNGSGIIVLLQVLNVIFLVWLNISVHNNCRNIMIMNFKALVIFGQMGFKFQNFTRIIVIELCTNCKDRPLTNDIFLNLGWDR